MMSKKAITKILLRLGEGSANVVETKSSSFCSERKEMTNTELVGQTRKCSKNWIGPVEEKEIKYLKNVGHPSWE